MITKVTTNRIACLAALAMLWTVISVPNALAQDGDIFRGIPKGDPNHIAMNRDWYIDVQCSFAEDSGTLAGQEMHGIQVGFLAPWLRQAFDGHGPVTGLAVGAVVPLYTAHDTAHDTAHAVRHVPLRGWGQRKAGNCG